MMRALLAKEIRALRPIALCIVGTFVLSMIYLFATEFPDQQLVDPVKWLREYRGGTFLILALFGLMIGAGLLINESQQGTLRFLDGLPVSRTRLFVAKMLAALAVIALVPLIGFPFDVVFGYLSRSSIDRPFPWNFELIIVGLQIVVGAYIVALASVVSFTRSWFALVVGIIFWSYVWLQQSGFARVALFAPNELLAVGLNGSRVLVPWGHLAAQAGATAGLLVVAWVGFLSLGDRAQFATDRLGRWRVLRVAGAGLRMLAPVVWVLAMVRVAGDSGVDEAKLAMTPLGEKAFARRETKRYEFLFRAAQREQAEPLIAAADQVHDAVAEFFAVPPPPARIVVDLASPVVQHALAQTNWTKIRLPLALNQDLAEQRLILGHETAHVFIEQLSDGHLSGHLRWIRFLHEGLATHVEQTLFGDEQGRLQNRRSVAAAWARGRVPFELLSDDHELSRTRDSNLAYPLGEVFARVLVETQGRDAPTRLLRAFARKNAPSGLKGTALWRDTMQAAGLDLDRVVAAYEAECGRLADEEEEFVKKLPRLTATVATEGAEIVIRPKFTGSSPGELLCVIEVENPLMNETRFLPRRDDGSFTLPQRDWRKTTLRYQLGWRPLETRLPVFEPWVETAL